VGGFGAKGLGVLLLAAVVSLGGCSRFKEKSADQYVYVTAKQQFLRDRVAAVSNRTGTVENGDKLKVLEHGRRFIRVTTEKGETGWVDERTVATQESYDAFAKLATDHAKDPAIATGVVRDEVYLHLSPGRGTEKFYRLAEGDKLSLLRRATLPKGAGPKAGTFKNPKQAAIPGAETGIPAAKAGATAGTPQSTAAAPAIAKPAVAAKGSAAATATIDAAAAEPPPMEDWWLVRDSKGRAGWMLSRMMDVDSPDVLTRYAEGQRTVGAYLLATVNDPDAPGDNKNIPEYVTVMSPYKAGLPYDFDQVRVFTWNPRMHRYETAFRERNIEGYLPVELKMVQDVGAKAPNAMTPLPGFSYKVLSAEAGPVIPDPVTGEIVPGPTITKTYRLEGNIVRRVLPPGTTAPDEAHPEIVLDKKDKKGKKRH
jgi:SH3-like domain-containing protein